jgi:hypothetical protein
MFVLGGTVLFAARYAALARSFLAYFSFSHVQELKEVIITMALRVIASVFMTGKENTLSSLPRGKFSATENV